MYLKTTSEAAFENFLTENHLAFEKIMEDTTRRPDYSVQAGEIKLIFEVKELAEDENFAVVPDPSRPDIRAHSRILGDHVRKKINLARKQLRFAVEQGIPAVLLVYNNLDPLHLFGTENTDFITAMYGEYTLLLDSKGRAVVDAFQGRNQSLREDWNTEFSALGRLSLCSGKMTVTLFENVFSEVKIPYEALPACFEVIRVEIAPSLATNL